MQRRFTTGELTLSYNNTNRQKMARICSSERDAERNGEVLARRKMNCPSLEELIDADRKPLRYTEAAAQAYITAYNKYNNAHLKVPPKVTVLVQERAPVNRDFEEKMKKWNQILKNSYETQEQIKIEEAQEISQVIIFSPISNQRQAFENDEVIHEEEEKNMEWVKSLFL